MVLKHVVGLIGVSLGIFLEHGVWAISVSVRVRIMVGFYHKNNYFGEVWSVKKCLEKKPEARSIY